AGDSAFAAIVERHGPMVNRVCRQVLGNPHDADDAFQATFLILIRKASLLYLSDSLGPWLHGVALRVASCARSAKPRDGRTSSGRVRRGCSTQPRAGGMILAQSCMRRSTGYRSAIELRLCSAGWRA